MPRTDCVRDNEITSWIVKARQLGEKCSRKFRYPGLVSPERDKVKFHIWSWDVSVGKFDELKWMYLKINGAYLESAAAISDWTFFYNGIKSTDDIETCGTAWANSPDLELQSQGTVL